MSDDAPHTPGPAPIKIAEGYLAGMRHHAEMAEKIYPPVLSEYARVKAARPDIAETVATRQALNSSLGKKSGLLPYLVMEADRQHIFDAGEHFVQARNSLREAGLNNIVNKLIKREPAVYDIKRTRDSFTHPDQMLSDRLTENEFPRAAEKAIAAVQETLEILQTVELAADKRAARDKGVQHLEAMQLQLAHFHKAHGYALTNSAELTADDVRAAIHAHEIAAGSFAALMKTALQQAGKTFDEHAFPNAPAAISVFPETIPGSHPVDALHVRRDDLAHHDPKPEHPGALARSEAGTSLFDKLPEHAEAFLARTKAAARVPRATLSTIQEAAAHSAIVSKTPLLERASPTKNSVTPSGSPEMSHLEAALRRARDEIRRLR